MLWTAAAVVVRIEAVVGSDFGWAGPCAGLRRGAANGEGRVCNFLIDCARGIFR